MSAPTRTPRRAPRAVGSRALAPIVIERVRPEVDAGRFPAKRLVGEACVVSADIFKDGHDQLAARVRYRCPGEGEWAYVAMPYDSDADRWAGAFLLDRVGEWRFTVEAWTDTFATWRSGLDKKVAAGQDVAIELLEGGAIVERAARACKDRGARASLTQAAQRLLDTNAPVADRARAALDPALLALVTQHPARDDLTEYSRQLLITVDRVRAGFAAWYEMFPRSQSGDPKRHGTFADAERQLPRVAQLGFDVVYLPPIHPIGTTFRKGKNNTLNPIPGDVGSPWAIGGEEGGHTAVHPQLGSLADFERFVKRANDLGLEVALDYALQASPDHPWVREHPDWFKIRPDGSIQYAENPPKKYQDIYPLNFWTDDREALWNACLEIFRFWMARGVRTFRVDNPHTKPFAFWEWVIADIKRTDPDVVFLSEAFTRPKKLLYLAKLGFSQSYTYFTWKNTTYEIRDWLREFTDPDVLEYYRGNLFANTPDILHEYLQRGGRPAFRIRLILAGTLSPLYGIYSGYELYENVPVREGSEEYLNSEKYELRPRDFTTPGNLDAEIRRINRIRRENPALQRADNLTFLRSENDQILFYRKSMPDGSNDLFIVVNLDPLRAHESMVHMPLETLGLSGDAVYPVTDLLTGAQFRWRGARNYVRLDPAQEPAHVLRLERGGTA
ncbi:MAG TPA: alpha-1,4-glucan--maltose-1-phosphate maltosyltransferase [Gemmatimonadaceae bacterium]|nr:alpha-1,4-glucan--maltose-1-phosphate maltosyltransferase [Gemmatimonadaceae bacterium]